jgi:hypothetical protein
LIVDNPDELEENDCMQHMRDVFEVVESESDDEFEDKKHGEPEKLELQVPADIRYISSYLWSWDLSYAERWVIIQRMLDLDKYLIALIDKMLSKELKHSRESYKREKIKANSSVYEGKELIGGTIVGCISRLEAIRALNPFAILIEEASEVMEPLLFSCLGPTTCKLEMIGFFDIMIGDHLQLQPSIMSKYDFEKVNKVNISMFERLICAPDSSPIPSAVLSVQRRMRTNICDLTRNFYSDITTIIDHPICNTRVIGEAQKLNKKLLFESAGSGLLVPCIQPQIYFWSHKGSMGKASVGMSKINQTESDMVCHLAKFLVNSGVPKRSIAILTPYKGSVLSKCRATYAYTKGVIKE